MLQNFEIIVANHEKVHHYVNYITYGYKYFRYLLSKVFALFWLFH